MLVSVVAEKPANISGIATAIVFDKDDVNLPLRVCGCTRIEENVHNPLCLFLGWKITCVTHHMCNHSREYIGKSYC